MLSHILQNMRCFYLLFFLLAYETSAQTLPDKVNASVSKSVVQQLISELDAYIFPEQANELKTYLGHHLSDYESITDPRALADKLTLDMRSVVHDKHLTVVYSDDAQQDQGATSPEGDERMHREEEARGLGIRTVARLPGNIGLLDLAYFSHDPEAITALDNAMTILHGSDALIIDLRRNMGGDAFTVAHLLTYLFSKQVELTSAVWRQQGKEHTDELWTLVYVPGPRFAETPVFVLLSGRTFSAGEQLAYDLKTLKRATLIGETTGGGANPAATDHSLGSHFEAFIPNGRALNPITKTNWEGVGVEPDVKMSPDGALLEAYKRALSMAHPAMRFERLDQIRQRAISDPAKALRDAGFRSE
jgi:retinol-binding protein 3